MSNGGLHHRRSLPPIRANGDQSSGTYSHIRKRWSSLRCAMLRYTHARSKLPIKCEGQTDGEGQQVKDILNAFQGATNRCELHSHILHGLQGKCEFRVMCGTSSSGQRANPVFARHALVNNNTKHHFDMQNRCSHEYSCCCTL